MRCVGEVQVLDVTATASPHCEPEDLRSLADLRADASARFVIHLPGLRHIDDIGCSFLFVLAMKLRPFTTQHSIPVVTDSEDVHRDLAIPDCLVGITPFPPFAAESDAVAFAREFDQFDGFHRRHRPRAPAGHGPE